MNYEDFDTMVSQTLDDIANIPSITISNSTTGNLLNQTLGTTGILGGLTVGTGTFTTSGTGNLTIDPNDLLFANIPPWTGLNSNVNSSLHVGGDAKFNKDIDVDGDIKIKGKSLDSRLSKIEERLNILHINKKLETKWKKLRELGEQYRKLEEDLLLQEKLWAELKR